MKGLRCRRISEAGSGRYYPYMRFSDMLTDIDDNKDCDYDSNSNSNYKHNDNDNASTTTTNLELVEWLSATSLSSCASKLSFRSAILARGAGKKSRAAWPHRHREECPRGCCY